MNNRGSIECKNITFKYSLNSKREIVKDFSFSFKRGKIYLLTGFSGCGKSTLAYLLAGLYPENKGHITNGEIFLNEKKIEEYSFPERAKKVAMMFQNADSQFCMETVKEELIFALENLNYSIEEIDTKVDLALEKCGILKLKDRRLTTLSGGEKQKVALAIVLAMESEILILDEPFANIDYESSQEIIKLLYELNKNSGVTLIIVDHRISLWKNIGYQLVILEENCKISDSKIVNILEDKQLNKRYVNENKIENKIIEVENLEISYENNILAKNINLYIPKGKITSIIGKSGSGKSTLLKILSGILKYKKGSIKIYGEELKKIKEKKLLNDIGIVFQNPQNQFLTYKVSDEIEFTIKRDKSAQNKNRKGIDEILKEFNLYEYRNSSPFSLSQGQQRKLAVLSMLVGGQEILLCDEPTYGQDNRTSRELMEYLKKESKRGITIILVSHDINLIAEYSDYIYEFKNGELIRVEYFEN